TRSGIVQLPAHDGDRLERCHIRGRNDRRQPHSKDPDENLANLWPEIARPFSGRRDELLQEESPMKHSLFASALAVAMLVAAPLADAELIHFSVNLTGSNEVPPNGSL